MFSKQITIIFFVSLFILSLSSFAKAGSIIPTNFIFGTNIRLGDTLLPDVSYLQNFLNQNPTTRVSDTGPGSDAELTNYYGPKTSDAVRRFQNLYAVEILEPAGLSTGTGFFGEFTRKKINSLLGGVMNSNPTQTVAKKTTVTASANVPNVTAVFSEESFEASTTTPNRPIISGLSPNLVYSDQDEIDIFGYNFTSIDNVVYGSLGSIENLTSSNNTITIKLKDFSQFDNARKYYSGTTTQVYLKVGNINGVSQELASVHYTFPNIGDFSSSFGNAGSEGDKSEESNTNALGVVDVESIDKEIQGMSPQGTLIKLIGGEETFDTIYGYTPSGMVSGGSSSIGGFGGGGAGGGSGSGGAGGGGGNIDNGGGEITNVTYCTCSGGILLEMEDVRGWTRNVFFRYGQSTLHEEYNIYTPGPNYIDGYTKETVECEVYNGESCDTEGTADWVIDNPRGIGTSLY